MTGETTFRKPTALETAFNRIYGFLVGLGLGGRDSYLLQVRGRKTGKVYSTPVYILEENAKRHLVAPRGYTQWVRNAEAAGEVTLKQGSRTETRRLQPIADGEKPAILKAYLDRFASTVQRYFTVRAGSPVEAFREFVGQYPVFELL